MIEALITLVTVVALLLGSPGPAPIALAAVGASFGARKGLPFLVGILVGLTAVIIGTTAGLSVLFALHPSLKVVTQLIGGLYIIYIAIKIATAPVILRDEVKEKTPSFVDGFVFNLLNPKAYAAFFAIFSQFLLPLENHALALIFTSVVCIVIAAIVDGVWLMLGGALRPIFGKPVQARALRIIFAILMIATVVWTFQNTVG